MNLREKFEGETKEYAYFEHVENFNPNYIKWLEQRKSTVMCNCHSYNADTGTEPEVILDPNKYFNWDSKSKTVCIDACIADQIKALWEANIWTRGCCCGHNEANPNVILESNTNPKPAIDLLKKIDPKREWDVLQWQLIKCD